MMPNAAQLVRGLGQSIWYDNMRRGLATSGELERLISLGVTGVTSNPTIFEKAILGSTDYDDAVEALARQGADPLRAYEALAVEDIKRAADLLRPVYEELKGGDGYASLEVSPALAHDTDGTVSEARRLWAALDRPNVMIKVPATAEGIPAIRRLIAGGINVNVTLIFSRTRYREVMDAYIAGLEERARAGHDIRGVSSVASFFVSRIDAVVDSRLEGRASGGSPNAAELRGKVAIANAKLAYQDFLKTFGDRRFQALSEHGARRQRPLWASTGTKNPEYSDVLYVESLIGPETVNTLPPATLAAFLDHGKASPSLETDLDDARETILKVEALGIRLEDVTSELLTAGVESFAASFDKLIQSTEQKFAELAVRRSDVPSSLGDLAPAVDEALMRLDAEAVVARMCRFDHTVWKPSPEEIGNRLGWLNVTDQMVEQTDSLKAFADEVRAGGIQNVVLLGMGGSSLGPEVLRQSFGQTPGFPALVVLDSTVPAWVDAVASGVDPRATLFLVSSKSGTTLETLSLYRFFRTEVEKAVGKTSAGSHFVAITDPGTPLEKLARDEGFRRTYLNPPNIGGRYSVLSYFGLVPAALTGIDIAGLLDRADRMRAGCDPCVGARDNPGAWLGATISAAAGAGRDKLTLIASPGIASFGIWAEQLIAESTGKEGRGIVPVASEPLSAPDRYSRDRLFVYMRLEGDDNGPTDEWIDRVSSAGHPVVRLALADRLDLGAEFYRWEVATAIAGSLMAINPFDQPDVQAAKDQTESILEDYEKSGELPRQAASETLQGLLARAKAGDYVAVTAYLRQTAESDAALTRLRAALVSRLGIATTVGYGPRYLHSTGQLHKGGKNDGIFLQLIAPHQKDLAIPGQQYSFGTLADAQAIGDFQALARTGRRVTRISVGPDPIDGIGRLIAKVEEAS